MALTRTEIARIAVTNASRVLHKHNLFKTEERIDVNKIIEDEDIVLNFQPLDVLAGAYIPVDKTLSNASGIIINERLPLTRQRYTAAHELGHYLRGDEASIDTESELFMNKYKRDDKELIAEEFASCLLMPRGLIKSNLIKMGIAAPQNHHFDSDDIYSLALRMGTSYSATVNRLYTLNFLSREQYHQFIKIKPKRIKETIGKDGLASSWNDIWEVLESESGSTFNPYIGDVLRVSLPENPATGYVWRIKTTSESITLFDETWDNNIEVIGSKGIHNFEFTVDKPGNMTLLIDYYRAWIPDTILRSFKINIAVQDKRHGISEYILIARGA